MAPISDTGRGRAHAWLAPARGLPVAAVAFAAVIQLGWRVTGSTAAADWLGVAIVVGLLVVAVLASGGAVRPPRPALAAIGLLLAYAGWTAASIAWSPVPTLAKEETQLVFVYVVAFSLPLLTLRGPRERIVALAALAAGPAAIAVAAGVRLAWGGDPQALFVDGRLELPIGYANADAALYLIGLWPALVLAAGRALPLVVRAGGVGAASACLAAAIATQSKGGAVGLVASSIAVFALCPGRLRLAVPTVLALLPAVAAAVPLTAPYRNEGAPDPAAGAGRTILLVAAVGLAAGVLYALLDRRLDLSARAVRNAGRAAAATLLIAVVAGLALLLASTGRPDESLRSAWAAFSEYHPDEGESGTHLATLGGSNRYDFWRVALRGAADEPLAGVGARGFGPLYLREGKSAETPARTHSLVFEVLLEGGIVGAVLLGTCLLLALALVARSARQRRLQGIAALGGGVGWLAHASVDWIWTFPATGLLFFLLLGVGCTAAGDPLARRVSAAAAGALALTVVLVLGGPWLSARLTERALEQPDRAASDLIWARRLDPISVQPDFAQARTATDTATALEALERAARKEPESVAARYVLGAYLLQLGQTAKARAELRAAARLSPRDPLIEAALARAAG